LFPALCAGGLVLCLALQLALTGGVEMPEEVESAGQARAALPSISGQFVPSILLENSIFSPGRTANGAAGDNAQAPLGGAVVAGAVSVRGRSYVIMQAPDGRVVRLAIGSVYKGWRLRALTGDGAVFDQGSQKLNLNFGAGAIQGPPQSAEYEEEQ
jgi:hypothetical protein